MNYLLEVGFTRDVWAHRIDIHAVIGRPMELDLAHDGRLVADIVREWAELHGEPFDLLALYALEGFLDRLSSSPRADDLVLKGGVLLAAYYTRRPTRDVDLQATHLAGDAETILALVRDVAAVHKDDGLVYDTGSATAEVIRDDEEYAGVRVRLIGRLLRARISFHVDVNVGDPIWPVPGQVEVSRLLGGVITVRGYPLSMVFAEKIVTAVQRGTINTRWRDYADIALLSAVHDVDELAASIGVVATHRNANLTPLDEALLGYAEIAQNRWRAWVRKQRLTDRLPEDFATVLQDVFTFAGPAVAGEIAGQTWVHGVRRWMPDDVFCVATDQRTGERLGEAPSHH